jgi:hypothetical protein
MASIAQPQFIDLTGDGDHNIADVGFTIISDSDDDDDGGSTIETQTYEDYYDRNGRTCNFFTPHWFCGMLAEYTTSASPASSYEMGLFQFVLLELPKAPLVFLRASS